MKILNSNKGVSLYLAFIITSMVLAIAFGLQSIFLGQVKTIRGEGYSVVAFYAADTGIENEMVDWSNPASSYSGCLDINENGVCGESEQDAFYNVKVLKGPEITGGAGEPGCTDAGLHYCVKSIGKYKGIKRAIEITY